MLFSFLNIDFSVLMVHTCIMLHTIILCLIIVHNIPITLIIFLSFVDNYLHPGSFMSHHQKYNVVIYSCLDMLIFKSLFQQWLILDIFIIPVSCCVILFKEYIDIYTHITHHNVCTYLS